MTPMFGNDEPQPCKKCGVRIVLLPNTEDKYHRIYPFDVGTYVRHQCKEAPKVKVFTPEEIEEFSRKRASGEI